jgi:ABC-type lipoprotein export system ATPase subunit
MERYVMTDQGIPLAKNTPRNHPSISPQHLLEARDLQRVFIQGHQEVIALRSASCSIQPGDRIAIIGPSGSGKSTLLHLFAALDQPTSGSITWPALGDPLDLRPTEIGVSLQEPSLLPPLNIAENVALPLLLQGYEPEESWDVAIQTLELLDLKNLADQLPEELSGGQTQRVALARTLITQPRLILADEPTGQLDHPTTQRLFDLLFSIITERAIALVVTTHDHTVAERFEQVWQMRQGFLEGAPMDA